MSDQEYVLWTGNGVRIAHYASDKAPRLEVRDGSLWVQVRIRPKAVESLAQLAENRNPAPEPEKASNKS